MPIPPDAYGYTSTYLSVISLSRTITRDIVGAALAAVQVLPSGVIPIWNATAAGVETAKQSPTVTPESIQNITRKILNQVIWTNDVDYSVD